VADYHFFFKTEASWGFYNNVSSHFKVLISLRKKPLTFLNKNSSVLKNLTGAKCFHPIELEE